MIITHLLANINSVHQLSPQSERKSVIVSTFNCWWEMPLKWNSEYYCINKLWILSLLAPHRAWQRWECRRRQRCTPRDSWLLLAGNSQVNSRAPDMDAEWRQSPACTRHRTRLQLICTGNLLWLYLDKAPSVTQTNTHSAWQTLVISSIYRARPHWVTVFWYVILLTLVASKVMCCQLADLISMEGRQSSGDERGVPAHAHLAHEQGVELTHILYWGLSKKKGRFGRRPLWLRLPPGF